MTRILLVGIATLALAARAAGPLFLESFEEGALPEGAERAGAGDGVAGAFVSLRGPVPLPRRTLPEPLSGDYTLTAWIRAAEWLDEGPSGFGRRVPPTVLALYDSETNAPVVLRVHRGVLQIAVNRDGRWDALSGWHELPVGEWVHVAAVRRGEFLTFYLNGVPEQNARLHRCTQPLLHVRVGTIAERTFSGDLDEVAVWAGALEPDAIAAMVPAEARARFAGFRVVQAPVRRPAYPGRELRLRDGASAPLAAGLSAHCLALPWFGGNRNDLLCEGVAFNAHPTVWRELRPGDYAPGVPVADLAPDMRLPEPPLFRVDREDGLFDLISTGRGTPLDNHLLYHRNTGAEGAPAFAEPVSISCDGAVFRSAYGAAVRGIRDLNADGVPDLLLVRGHNSAAYPPDAPESFWTGKELPSTGKGRGYSINGTWLGYEGRHVVEWARGDRSPDGSLRFGPRLPVFSGQGDFPLQWKGHGTPVLAHVTLRDEDWLVMAGDIDRILAVPMRVEGDAIRCGDPRDLLADGPRLRLVYYPHAIDVRDLDGDATPELLLCGNPGSLSILRGRAIGGFREEAARQVGGPLAMQTLTVPCRADWDGDGVQDLIGGDASGWLVFWPGTADPEVYGAPRFMRTPAGAVHVQAGYSGSIQGPNEARWGYMNPTVGDWDLDGKPDLITCDINADMMLYRQGSEADLVAEPVPFTREGRKLPAAWRQRAAILPPETGIAGTSPTLLHLDRDGILAIGIPAAPGATEIREQRRLRYDDGDPVRLDGPGGLWGRAKFAVCDWDGDGTFDVLFGTNRSDQQFFSDEFARREATPFVMLNRGTAAAPVFSRPIPIRLGDRDLAFGVHIAAVWPTDLDGDGREDLIIGAEDGRVYRFFRRELTP